MDKIVHFEIPADDIARAKEFYGSTFGWELEDMVIQRFGQVSLAGFREEILERDRYQRAAVR